MSGPDRIWLSRAWAETFTTQDERENVAPFVRRDPAVLAALPEVAAMVAEAVAQEREWCAKVADASPDSHWGPTIAAALRSGGKP